MSNISAQIGIFCPEFLITICTKNVNKKNGYIFAIYWLQFYIVTWQSTAQQSNLKRTKVDFGKINGLFRHHSKRSPNSNSLFLFSSGFVSFSSVLPVFFSPICYTSPANFSLKCIQAQKKSIQIKLNDCHHFLLLHMQESLFGSRLQVTGSLIYFESTWFG